ncbi:MAG: acyl-CoA dehydrogenase family protein [Gammaproteobacteria bacterium]|nr:acyl-CoA dehydrogenase family protein [Gammaproteobacteria bacterium]
MNEQQRMLADTVGRLFPGIAAEQRGHGARGDFAGAWERVRELGIDEVLVPEEAGGFGGNWQDAAVVMHACGQHALPLPVAETLVARKLLCGTDIAAPPGAAITLAACAGASVAPGGVTLRLSSVPWGGGEACVLTAFEHEGVEYLALYDTAAASQRRARDCAASEPRFDLVLDESALLASSRCEHARRDLRACGALLRAVQTGGALQGALALTIAHVNERVQFGRALSKFQVVQHQLALLAEEAAAVSCAAGAACLAADTGDATLAIACAKLRANRSVHQATSIAHQLHGAIGFTREHALHHFTQRLWAWRSDFGNDRFWADSLGRMVTRGGASNLWSRVTG